VLLSSKPQHARSAKYSIKHVVCTHMAADDEAYGCVQLTEDDARITGIRLKQELVPVAERALRQNMQVSADNLKSSLKLGASCCFVWQQTQETRVKCGSNRRCCMPCIWGEGSSCNMSCIGSVVTKCCALQSPP
jgi:hypothetical protein